jgi:hypothetical protein
MSSPTSRPPIAPSDWAPHATRARPGMERPSAPAESDSLCSPYAPNRTGEHAGAQRPSSANDLQPPLPGLAQTGPTDAAIDKPGADAGRKDVVDLERLEESIRWLERQEAAVRLPRVAPLPLVAGLTPPDTPRYSRGHAGMARRKSLEPEFMPPPPAAPRRRYLRASLGLVAAAIAAGVVGYYVARADWWPSANPWPAMQVAASSALRTVALVARKDDPDALPASEASDRARAIAQLAKPPERSAMAMVPAGELEAQIVGKAPRALDPEEIKLLVKQGEQFAAAGDLVGARAVLQRAAQAGDASAAVALGATYDPVVLAQIGAVGFSADIEQARRWYQTAERLGAAEATRRLKILANR